MAAANNAERIIESMRFKARSSHGNQLCSQDQDNPAQQAFNGGLLRMACKT